MWRGDAVEALLARTVDVLDPGDLPPPGGRASGSGARSSGDGPSPADLEADLAAAGLPAGSAILLAMPNGKALLATFFAVLRAGLTPVPVPPGAGTARLTAIAASCGAAGVITRLTTRAGDTPGPGGPQQAAPGETPRRLVEISRFAGTPRSYPNGSVIIPTSGTSGIATGCVHHIDRLLRNATRHADAVGQRPGDTLLVTLPMYFSYALVAQCLAALARDSHLIISGPPFTVRHYAHTLERHHVTISSLTPVLVRRLLAEGLTLPRGLRALTIGGDHLPPELVAPLLGVVPGGELYLTYGLTEAGPRVSTLAAHAEPGRRHGSAGLPLPGVRTSLRPSTLADGTRELLVHTDTAMLERVPEGKPRPDGSIATGDLFDIDGDGYHWFRGRISDSVTVNGEKVWLPSVRTLAAGLAGVRRAVTRVHRDGADTHYDLEIYVDEPGPGQDRAYHRELSRHLLRAERPRAVIVQPYAEEGWHK